MRRKDREVTDLKQMLEIMDACQIVRIGLADGMYPYIVPLNFGYTVEGAQVTLYIHGAMAGRKYELLRKNRACSFEMDIPLELDCMDELKDVTMRYKSLMGTATVELLEGKEREDALDHVLMGRYEQTRHFDYDRSVIPRTAVFKLTVQEMVGKVNPIRK